MDPEAGDQPHTYDRMVVFPTGGATGVTLRPTVGVLGDVPNDVPCVTGGCLNRAHHLLRGDDHRKELLVECPVCGVSFWAPLQSRTPRQDRSDLGPGLG